MKAIFDQASFDLQPTENGYTASIGGKTFEAELLNVERGRLDLVLNGQRLAAYVTTDGLKRWVTVNGRTYLLSRPAAGRRRGAGADHGAGLAAPMPGQIRAVNVAEGEHVRKGQTLLVVEAMKMEIRVQAPHDGVVVKLFVSQGQTVERGQLLAEMQKEEDSPA